MNWWALMGIASVFAPWVILGLALLAASDQLVYASCTTDAECEAIEARVSFSRRR